MSTVTNSLDRRQCERFTMPHQYTAITVHPAGSMTLCPLHGHVYDISESGIRLELDEPLDIGSEVSFQVQLPMGHGTVTGQAAVVWVNSQDDDPGPRRCALYIRSFLSATDQSRLTNYIGDVQPLRAA